MNLLQTAKTHGFSYHTNTTNAYRVQESDLHPNIFARSLAAEKAIDLNFHDVTKMYNKFNLQCGI